MAGILFVTFWLVPDAFDHLNYFTFHIHNTQIQLLIYDAKKTKLLLAPINRALSIYIIFWHF
jgi:hypothetical protein